MQLLRFILLFLLPENNVYYFDPFGYQFILDIIKVPVSKINLKSLFKLNIFAGILHAHNKI